VVIRGGKGRDGRGDGGYGIIVDGRGLVERHLAGCWEGVRG